jgi:hypothetical protein
MLRIYFLQQWFNLSDPQAEDAIYDSEAMRRFARVELGDDVVPDETTIHVSAWLIVSSATALGARVILRLVPVVRVGLPTVATESAREVAKPVASLPLTHRLRRKRKDRHHNETDTSRRFSHLGREVRIPLSARSDSNDRIWKFACP